MQRLRTALNLMAAGLLALGAAFLAAPASTDLPASAPLLTPDRNGARPAATDAGDSLAEEIVLANVFSPTRTAPLHRVMPPELEGDSVNGMLATASEPDADSTPKSDIPALYGTMVGPDAVRALLRLDPAIAAPRLYAAGESAGGYRIVSIAPREVTLAGPRGRVILRLPPKEERQ